MNQSVHIPVGRYRWLSLVGALIQLRIDAAAVDEGLSLPMAGVIAKIVLRDRDLLLNV